MSLTDTQKQLIQQTFAQVRDGDALMGRFYEHLFKLDPDTRPLFKGDLAAQRQKLLQTLAVVVHGLDHLETLVPTIQALGQRHVQYGVTAQQWDSVGAALLAALAEHFEDAFTAEVRTAWATAYALIATTAIAAAYPVTME